MNNACFTYGSLMCEDIMAFVSGQSMQGVAARLADYVRHPVREEDYPGMVPCSGASVPGVLYRGLSGAALIRLDRFEGEMYERRRVAVAAADGNLSGAWTYVFRSEFAHLLLPGDWSFERFLADGQARFRNRYMGFDVLD